MDAAKIAHAKGNPQHNISDAQAVRIAMATALRDLADEIESGDRVVTEIQTFELAQGMTGSASIMHLVSILLRKPLQDAPPKTPPPQVNQ